MRAYVGLGGNLGDVPAAIGRALDQLERLPLSRLVRASSLYRNPALAPVHGSVSSQPDFVNAVAALDTGLEPLALLDRLLGIEKAAGRRRTGARWAPRTLDLDLLLYGDLTLDDPRLTLPHPAAHLRAFVLHPLAEIDAGVRIPGHGTVAELCRQVPADALERVAPGRR